MFGTFGLLQFSSTLNNTQNPTIFSFNFNLLLLIALSCLYIKLQKVVGLLTTLYMFISYSYVQHLYELAYQHDSLDSLWKFFLIVKIFSWIFQFVGHGVFEGRKPALTDNFYLTLVAPFFVTAEVLFFFGWKKDMLVEIDADIKKRINDFKKAKKDKANVKSK